MIHIVNNTAVVFVKDILWIRNKPLVNCLSVKILFDDNFSKCELLYSLYNHKQEESSKEIVDIFELITSTEGENPTIQGEDYQNWSGNPEYTFEYIANLLQLEIIK